MVNTCCENKYHKSFAPTILVPTNNQNVYAPGFYFRHFLRLLMIPSQKNISNRVKFKDVFRNTSSVIIRKNGREQKQTPRGATVCNGEKSITYFSVESVLTQVATKIIRGPSKFLLTFQFQLRFCLRKIKEAFWQRNLGVFFIPFSPEVLISEY